MCYPAFVSFATSTEAREVFLSWVSKMHVGAEDRGAVGAEEVGCGEGVSPSPLGRGLGRGLSRIFF